MKKIDLKKLQAKEAAKKRKTLKKLTRKQMKQIGVYDIKPSELRYSAVLPMNKLWQQYMTQLIGNK